jgi:peroxiredoxin Q/BCP
MGIERSTFIFDSNKQLIKVWRKVKVADHVNEVLASIS